MKTTNFFNKRNPHSLADFFKLWDIMKKNDTYFLDITDITNEGMGVGHVDGMAVFVPFTLPGDRAEVLIVKVKSSYAYGKCINIIESSENRTEPVCDAFKKCGGCQLMHMSYDAQVSAKKKFIYDALTRLGGQDKNLEIDMIGASDITGYRNKMVYPIGEDKAGNIVCGFYAQRSHNIIPLNSCALGMGDDSVIINAVLKFMKKYNIKPYNEEKHKGSIRRIFIRRGRYSGETMVVISANSKKLPNEEELAKSLKEADKTIESVILNTNEKRTNLVLGEQNRVLYGKSFISDTLCGNKYEISPHSFFQVNPVQTENLYKKAIEYAEISQNDTVFDIYCGIGTISLTAAKVAKKVIGVEIVEEAISNAKENAIKNGVSNAEFFAGSAEEIVPKLVESGEKPDIVILDPPRKGSDNVTLETIISAKPKRIVYVSCNPATLARDIKVLNEGGYKLEKVTGVDMFPNSVHVETVVSLSIK